MDDKQQENRLRATRKFMRALNELEMVLQSESSLSEQSKSSTTAIDQNGLENQDSSLSLASGENLGALLDDAVQDIEQFMGKHLDDSEV